jgi:hypothetical protein
MGELAAELTPQMAAAAPAQLILAEDNQPPGRLSR